MKTPVLALLVLAGSAWTRATPAQPTPPPLPAPSGPTVTAVPDSPPPDFPPGRLTNHRAEMWRVEVAYRGSFIHDAGYGPFSTNQYFVETAFTASRTVWRGDSWSFAPGIGFDFGDTSATARGQGTSLSMQRINVPLEGRRHFGPWGYAFARVAPGLAQQSATLDEASAPGMSLKKSAWMFATDVSAGYAFLVTPRFDRFEQKARFWLQADVGYGWVAGDELALVPSGGTGNVGGVDVGTLSMTGAFFRLGGAVSF